VRNLGRLIELVGQFMWFPRREAFRVVLIDERISIPRSKLKTVYERGCDGEGASMPILTCDGSRRVSEPCSGTVDL